MTTNVMKPTPRTIINLPQDQRYHDHINDILNHGEWEHDNRTGIATQFKIGSYWELDASPSSFPIITTKRVYWKSAFAEMIGFLRGYSSAADFRKLGCKVWDQNANENTQWLSNPYRHGQDHLGRVYGVQHRQWINTDWQTQVELVDAVNQLPHNDGVDAPFTLNNQMLTPVYNDNTDDFIGKMFKNNNNEQFKVIERVNTQHNPMYKIQFINSTSIKNVTKSQIKRGQVKDLYSSVCCTGEKITNKPPYYSAAYKLWHNMMAKYHLKNNESHNNVFVDSNWRCFENFWKDLPNIIGFDQWRENPNKYALDKDYYSSNYYGKGVVIFLPKNYNKYVSTNTDGSMIRATHKQTNQIFEFTSPAFFTNTMNIKNKSIVDHALKTQNGQTKTWSFERVYPPPGKTYKQKFFIDQINMVINDLKNNVDNRREIITAWNPNELNKMALPPCHMTMVFSLVKNKSTVDLFLLLRSSDGGLGLPYNITQYAFLLNIIAHVTNKIPGTLRVYANNAHIYQNHIDALNIQLNRTSSLHESGNHPQLVINQNVTLNDIISPSSNVTLDQIAHINYYKPHPPVKMDMAV